MNVDAIGIVVKEVKETIKFYGLFGIEFKELGDGHFEGVASNGVRLMLDSVELMKKINPDWSYRCGSNIILCHKSEAAPDVDAVYNKVVEAGFEKVKEPWDAFWGQRYASVKDPDGNQVDIFADL